MFRDRLETPSRSASTFSSNSRPNVTEQSAAHQVVEFRVLAEERLPFLLLTADEVLDVHIEAGRGDAVGAERGLLALLEQQRQQREQRVAVDAAPTRTLWHNTSRNVSQKSPENTNRYIDALSASMGVCSSPGVGLGTPTSVPSRNFCSGSSTFSTLCICRGRQRGEENKQTTVKDEKKNK